MTTPDPRNAWGYPVATKAQALDRAVKYAAEVRKRNRLPCNCETCKRDALLPAVLNITNNWRIV